MTTLKSISSGTSRFCTVLDVITQFPKIVSESINLDESDSPITRYSYMIDQAIMHASQKIKVALLPIYKSETALAASAPWVGIIISNKQNSTPSSRLISCQAGTSALCEMFTLSFTSSSSYTATGILTGNVGNGTTTTDFTSSGDGDLIIPASSVSGIFSGTFATNDKIFISINKWDPFIASIATYKATAEALRSIFFEHSINDESNLIEKLSNHGERDLNRLQRPFDPDGYQLSALPSRDFSEIQLGDWDGDVYDDFGNADSDMFQDYKIDTYTK